MAAAIKTTLKGTRHRWCRWNVLRKAKQKIGTPYSKRSAFKKRFNRLITDEVSPSAFEQKWQDLVMEYKLEKKQIHGSSLQDEGNVGKAILHGHLLCRYD